MNITSKFMGLLGGMTAITTLVAMEAPAMADAEPTEPVFLEFTQIDPPQFVSYALAVEEEHKWDGAASVGTSVFNSYAAPLQGFALEFQLDEPTPAVQGGYINSSIFAPTYPTPAPTYEVGVGIPLTIISNVDSVEDVPEPASLLGLAVMSVCGVGSAVKRRLAA